MQSIFTKQDTEISLIMQKFILYIFIISCYKRSSFRSYNKRTIVRVKTVLTSFIVFHCMTESLIFYNNL